MELFDVNAIKKQEKNVEAVKLITETINTVKNLILEPNITVFTLDLIDTDLINEKYIESIREAIHIGLEEENLKDFHVVSHSCTIEISWLHLKYGLTKKEEHLVPAISNIYKQIQRNNEIGLHILRLEVQEDIHSIVEVFNRLGFEVELGEISSDPFLSKESATITFKW